VRQREDEKKRFAMLLSNQEAEAVSILYLLGNDANVSSLGYK
jgi:hypothetical protein